MIEKRPTARNMVRLINAFQKKNSLGATETTDALDINRSTLLRWKFAERQPSMGAYFKVINNIKRFEKRIK